jgi:pimeloyl-ACP methyl ester carboxylesterase
VNVRKVVPDTPGEIEMTSYRTTQIEGLSVFYREAGNPANPTLVLLHGYPSSSFMFRNLIPALEDRFQRGGHEHV